jgi:hypothetical protein
MGEQLLERTRLVEESATKYYNRQEGRSEVIVTKIKALKLGRESLGILVVEKEENEKWINYRFLPRPDLVFPITEDGDWRIFWIEQELKVKVQRSKIEVIHRGEVVIR